MKSDVSTLKRKSLENSSQQILLQFITCQRLSHFLLTCQLNLDVKKIIMINFTLPVLLTEINIAAFILHGVSRYLEGLHGAN